MTRRASSSQFSVAMAGFRRSKPAVFCMWVLGILYFGAVFADFLAPYSFKTEERNYSYAPPTELHFTDEKGKLSWPFVYGVELTFGEFHERIYTDDLSQKYPLKFFIKGDAYELPGIRSSSFRLFGVEAPGKFYLLGADSRGRDLFSRLLYGARVSLFIGIIGVAISYSIGLILGGIAGYYGGLVDEIIMRICEMVMMIPGFYLLLALRAAVPDNFNSVQVFFAIVIILSFIGWAGLARIIRGMCLSIRTQEYVLAAKAMGVSDLKIIIRHVLPQTVSYSIISVMLAIPGYILGESALSLLGLGIVDPFASWGNMLKEAMNIIQIKASPWILIPGFFILITVMCFNVIGDALRDALDPKFKTESEF